MAEDRESLAKVTKKDLDSWTDSLDNVMGSEDGRRRFRHFLEVREFTESVITLDFWVSCKKVLCESTDITDNELMKRAEALVKEADENKNINLNVAEIQNMERDVQKKERDVQKMERDVQKMERDVVLGMLKAAKKSTQELLETKYDLFKALLLREQERRKS